LVLTVPYAGCFVVKLQLKQSIVGPTYVGERGVKREPMIVAAVSDMGYCIA